MGSLQSWPVAMGWEGLDGAWAISPLEAAALLGLAAVVIGLWIGSAWLASRVARRRGLNRALGWLLGLALGPLAPLILLGVVLRLPGARSSSSPTPLRGPSHRQGGR